jgi:putative DNA primase/helicase
VTGVPPPTDPAAVARQYVKALHTSDDGKLVLRRHRGDFYRWAGTCWQEFDGAAAKSSVWLWLEHATYESKDGSKAFEPNRNKVGNVLEALQAIGYLGVRVEPPAWIGDEQPLPAKEMVAMDNGLLHLPSRELLPHTPDFFNLHSLPFDYDPKAPEPKRWFRFLRELWEDDEQVIATLAEIFGYVLSGDTRQQKLFMLVGPKRSGKGTIARVLTGLFGAHNVAAPTLSGLTQDFGMQPLIGKPLAVVSDARLGERQQGLIAVERLLAISGEDTLTVNRKFRDQWTGRLPSRFLILTNELPRFIDSSGALASRFVLLTTANSFYGHENPALTEELLAEAPGIFNWSLAGLDRLTERGFFVRPDSAEEAIRQMEDLSSPISAFVRDVCVVGPEHEVGKSDLFDAWKVWCEEEGKTRPGDKAMFGRNLRAALPRLTDARPGGHSESRARVWRGVGLPEYGRVWTRMDAPVSETEESTEPAYGRAGTRPDAAPAAGPASIRVPGRSHRGADSGEAQPELSEGEQAQLADADAFLAESDGRWVPPEERE